MGATEGFFDPDGHCLPFPMIEELYSVLEYGSPISCWIKVLQQTGCRIKETDWMQRSYICDSILYWKLGKNQSGYSRHEQISRELIEEIDYMRAHYRTMGDNLFAYCCDTMRKIFLVLIMPRLSAEWKIVRRKLQNKGFSFERRYQLKGFRKNFQTILFYYYWKKYDDAALALELVSKRMHHSSARMTVQHYVENVEQLGIRNIKIVLDKLPCEWVRSSGQMQLVEFGNFDNSPRFKALMFAKEDCEKANASS